MSPQRVVFLFNLLCFFFTIIFKAEATLPTATIVKVRRTQSMRPLTSHKSANDIHTLDRSSFHSSSASDVSITELKHDDPQPFPSTSTLKRGDTIRPQKADHSPLIEQPKHVSFVEVSGTQDASVSTHRNGDINPARDGVYARARNALLRFGTAAVVGVVIGGVVVEEKLLLNISVPLTNSTKASALISDDSDGIIPL